MLSGGNIWDGGDGIWTNLNWNGGRAPMAGANMFIDNTNASTVILDADFAANSLVLGANADSQLIIDSSRTLTAAVGVVVGPSGTLLVDGTLTVNSFENRGSSTFDAGSVLSFIGGGTLSLKGGTLTYDSTTPATPGVVNFYGDFRLGGPYITRVPAAAIAALGAGKPESLLVPFRLRHHFRLSRSQPPPCDWAPFVRLRDPSGRAGVRSR